MKERMVGREVRTVLRDFFIAVHQHVYWGNESPGAEVASKANPFLKHVRHLSLDDTDVAAAVLDIDRAVKSGQLDQIIDSGTSCMYVGDFPEGFDTPDCFFDTDGEVEFPGCYSDDLVDATCAWLRAVNGGEDGREALAKFADLLPDDPVFFARVVLWRAMKVFWYADFMRICAS